MTMLKRGFSRTPAILNLLHGRFDVRRLRLGRMPVLQLDFSFANKAITGNMTSVVAPRPVRPMNWDVVRKTN